MHQRPAQETQYRIADALDLFLLDCAARRLSAETQNTYKDTLTNFIGWCKFEYLHEISHIQIRKFLVSLQDRGLSSATQHKYARNIKTFFNYCVRDELIPVSPFAKVQMPKVEQKVLKSYTPEEIKKILKACRSERDTVIVLLLLDSGMRASELLGLNVGDVDMHDGAVTIQKGKGAKGRVVYIGAKSRKQLLRYLLKRKKQSGQQPIFISALTKKRLTLYGLSQAMERIEKRSGVENVTCHGFRRTFALEFLRGGGNIYVLARLMGHADIDVLKRYLAIVQDDLKAAHEKYGPGDNMRF
jgi:integrase/recombinase XerD